MTGQPVSITLGVVEFPQITTAAFDNADLQIAAVAVTGADLQVSAVELQVSAITSELQLTLAVEEGA